MHPEPAVQAIFGEYPYWDLIANLRDFAAFLLDRQGHIVSWNEGARLLFGYERDEIVGEHFRMLFPLEDRERGVPEGKLRVAAQESRVEDMHWRLRKDGELIWVNGVTNAVFDKGGQLRGFSKIVRDDTKLKEREDALRISQERFQLVARATNEVIWDWNLESNSVWWNDNLQKVFGHVPDGPESDPDWWKAHVHSDDRQHVIESIHHAIDEGETWSSEYRFERADGTFAQVFDRGYVQRNATGRPTRILGTMMDITQRKQMEEERRLFERLADNSPDCIGICSLEGQTLYLNATGMRLLGPQTLDEVKRIPIIEFVAPDDREFVLNEFLPRVIREGQGSTEVRFLNQATGDTTWMTYVLFLIRDDKGEPLAFATISRDITARREAEAERERLVGQLEFERKRLATIFQNIPAFASLYRGPNFVYEITNPAYYRLIGDRDVIGKPVLEALPEIANQGFAELLKGVYTTGEPYMAREAPVNLRDGVSGPLLQRFVDLIYQPVHEADGSISGVFSYGVDVTEYVRSRQIAEQATREAEAARHTAEVATERAEDANRVKDEFLATLSHELRTPLNAILGWSNLLQTGQVEPEDALRGLATIERNARAQAQLIEDILDVSRIITGKMRLDVQTIDLGEIIEEAIATVLPAAQARDIRLQRVLDAGATLVSGDASRLQQVVWNLLSNAIKFTPRGGRVQIRLERVNSHVEIIVTDGGIGIAPDVLPHVFDRFRQADSSSTRAHGGLGLGLAIVRHLIELHGGSVEAHSEGLGTGATFVIKLPLVAVRSLELPENEPEPRTHPTASRPAPVSDLPSLDGLHILVVDDQEDTRTFLTIILEKCGARVSSAASAAQGLEAVRQLRPDVLVSDIGMPHEDGYSFIKSVRSLPADKGGQTPAAALTAFARVEDRVRALRAGFQSHIPKPVEPLELVTVLANLAGRHEEA